MQTMPGQISLNPVDYAVAVIILVVPMSIGLWYAVKDAKKTTREEYLLGGRRMSILPVALSTFTTFLSAISLMGNPTEAYFFGAIGFSTYIGVSACYLFGYFTFVPLLYPLRLTSVYEYIQRRYRSDALRLISPIIGMLGSIFYQAIVLLSPALALQACADLPLWISIAVIGTVGTIYTAIGGFKSVIWTDTFQTVMIFVGIFANIIKACLEVGGIGEVWHLSERGGRTEMDKFSLDPRVRHTQWSLIVGFFFMWSSNCLSQASVQRISSMKSLRDAKRAFLINVPLHLMFGGINFLMGLAIYAYYAFVGCDPYEAGLITNKNQLLPYFVLHTMTDLPGMAGLLIGVLCCGSLSTLSSGINAMAANTVEDLLRRPLRSVKEATLTFITKVFVVVYGVSAIGLAYVVQSVDGPVTQMASAVVGALGSPVVGIILMGSFVPWANKYGALVGVAVSLVFNLWISIGSVIQASPLKTLPPVTTENCLQFSDMLNSSFAQYNVTNETFTYVSRRDPVVTMVNNTRMVSSESSATFFLYDITYEWYSPMGCIVCVATGLIVSFFTNLKQPKRTRGQCANIHPTYTDAKYIIPWMRRFWGLTHQKCKLDREDNNESEVTDAAQTNSPLKTRKYKTEDVMQNNSPLLDSSTNHRK